jgi:hypothetical protein
VAAGRRGALAGVPHRRRAAGARVLLFELCRAGVRRSLSPTTDGHCRGGHPNHEPRPKPGRCPREKAVISLSPPPRRLLSPKRRAKKRASTSRSGSPQAGSGPALPCSSRRCARRDSPRSGAQDQAAPRRIAADCASTLHPRPRPTAPPPPPLGLPAARPRLATERIPRLQRSLPKVQVAHERASRESADHAPQRAGTLNPQPAKVFANRGGRESLGATRTAASAAEAR